MVHGQTISEVFRPAAGWESLRRRVELLRQVRRFFDERGFLEVETPILAAGTVVDRHLEPFFVGSFPSVSAENTANKDSSGLMWLQTSPEAHMKRLLAAGAGPIYQIARVFRREERGPLHNPEFTLLEWYQPGANLEAGMTLTSDLCDALLHRGPAERLSYREAFLRHAGVDPHLATNEDLIAAAAQHGLPPPPGLKPADRDGWLDLLLVELVQPHLGVNRPTLLYDYPASQAALARVRPDNPPVAERFELYVAGMELANGYNELLDAEELRERVRRTNALRIADGKLPLPENRLLLSAMEHGLPSAVGVALGFDRLVMLALDAARIDEVIAFPFERA